MIPRNTQDHISLQLQGNENMKISMFQSNSVFFGTLKRCANDQENQKNLKADILDPGWGRVGATKALSFTVSKVEQHAVRRDAPAIAPLNCEKECSNVRLSQPAYLSINLFHIDVIQRTNFF